MVSDGFGMGCASGGAAYEKYVFLWGFLAKLVLMDEMQQKILHRLQGVEYNEDFGQAVRTDMQKAIELGSYCVSGGQLASITLNSSVTDTCGGISSAPATSYKCLL